MLERDVCELVDGWGVVVCFRDTYVHADVIRYLEASVSVEATSMA